MKRHCPKCASTDLLIDACGRWDDAANDWVLASTQDTITCGKCDHEFIHSVEMHDFTVWCRDADGTGTMWVGHLTASTIEEAKRRAKLQCADDWGCDPDLADDQIRVIGVAAGNVDIREWHDDD